MTNNLEIAPKPIKEIFSKPESFSRYQAGNPYAQWRF